MSGSSVSAMVVGTVFIMVFGMATVTLVDSVGESIKNAEYTLDKPEVKLTSVTDKEESTGPVQQVTLSAPGGDYTNGATCGVSGSSGTGLQLLLAVDGSDMVTGATVSSSGSGYTEGETVTINCGATNATVIIDVHEQNTIFINNTGPMAVNIEHIIISLSDTDSKVQGVPFTFKSVYSGSEQYIFPGEELSATFPLDSTSHGFAIGTDPNRAHLAIYDHRSAITVTITNE